MTFSFRRIGFGLSLVLGGVLFAFLLFQEGLPSIIQSITAFGFLPFLGFFILSVLNFCFYVLRWQIILHAMVKKTERLRFSQIFFDRMAGFAVSYLTPAAQVGGEPVRIAALHADGVPLKPASSSVILDISFEMLAYLLFILAGVILAILEGFSAGSEALLLIFGVGFFVSLLLVFLIALSFDQPLFSRLLPKTLQKKHPRFADFAASLRESEKLMSTFLRHNPKKILAIVSLSLLMFSLRVLETVYLAWFFGVTLGFSQAFLVTTLPGIALLLPVPAGLGLFEGGFSALFTVLAIPLSAVSFALVIRARDSLFIAVGILHIFMQGRRFLIKKNSLEKTV